jgi:hypothetical protein
MPYDYLTGGSANVTAAELVTSVFDQVDSGFYDVLYPELLWREVIGKEGVKTDINAGAMNYVYRSRDHKGMGNFVLGDSRNIPRVGMNVGQVTVPILDAAVGAVITDAEARRYQFGYQSALAQDYGEIMKKASEYHVERTFFFGNPQANFEPWLDYPTVQKIPASALWSTLTPQEIADEINTHLTTVWTNSKTIHLPGKVWLPPDKYSVLLQGYVLGVGTGATSVNVTILEFIKKNNIYTAQTGKELDIRALRYLEGAGVGGVDRMVIQQDFPGNFILPFPLPYTLAQPVPIALGVELFSEYIFGSFHVRYPGAMAYVDGI